MRKYVSVFYQLARTLLLVVNRVTALNLGNYKRRAETRSNIRVASILIVSLQKLVSQKIRAEECCYLQFFIYFTLLNVLFWRDQQHTAIQNAYLHNNCAFVPHY